MTREEAIKYLNEFIIFKKISNITEDEAVKCFKLAVDALQQQPSEGEKVIRISKGTLKARTGKYVIYDVEWLKEHFNTTEAKIYGQQGERTEERTEMHACDCINRKEAIDALERIFNQCEEIEAHFPDGDPDKTGYKMFPDYMTVWKYLHRLPSAQPEERTMEEFMYGQDMGNPEDGSL